MSQTFMQSPDLRSYLKDLVPPRHPELAEMEAIAQEEDFPIIGPIAGQLCYLVARMVGARRVFELGSGFGYSTAWFARAIEENGGGEVHHTVWDADLSKRAQGHLSKMGFSSEAGLTKVHYHISEAVEALRGTSGQFDIIFNDIDKHQYPGSLPAIEGALRPGGVLIIDNMLWGGEVWDSGNNEADTNGVREITAMLTRSPKWESTLVPVRDGVMVSLYLGPS